jgi:pimeloyl-ACP methyl ester carboxylesterase
MQSRFKLAVVVLAVLTFGPRCQAREPPANAPGARADKSGDSPSARKGDGEKKEAAGQYASVNGLKLYYETHPPAGSAADGAVPLILLHGGVGSTGMFDEIVPALNKGRTVIAVDMQAHGRTGDIDRPLRYELMADDVAALVKQLRIEKVDVMGFSMGGGVALRLAIQHPGTVRKLVVVSAPVKRDGWYPGFRTASTQTAPQDAEAMKPTPIYKSYAKIAPNPKDWPTLITKIFELAGRDYDWSKEVAGLKVPILIAVGDADAVRTAHAVEFFELLGGGKKDGGWDGAGKPASQLAILPGVTHYDIIDKPALVAAAIAFLDAIPPKSGRSDKEGP